MSPPTSTATASSMVKISLPSPYPCCNNMLPKVWRFQRKFVSLQAKIQDFEHFKAMILNSKRSGMRGRKVNMMIFASSCIESAARKLNIPTKEMYVRMKEVGLIDGFVLKCYDGLHTQSRQHVTEDVLGALQIWEAKKAGSL